MLTKRLSNRFLIPALAAASILVLAIVVALPSAGAQCQGETCWQRGPAGDRLTDEMPINDITPRREAGRASPRPSNRNAHPAARPVRYVYVTEYQMCCRYDRYGRCWRVRRPVLRAVARAAVAPVRVARHVQPVRRTVRFLRHRRPVRRAIGRLIFGPRTCRRW